MFGSCLKLYWNLFGTFWNGVGTRLEPFFRFRELFLGRVGILFSEVVRSVFWKLFWNLLGFFRNVIWQCFVSVLELCWTVLDCFRNYVGPCFGTFRNMFGTIWKLFGTVLEPFGNCLIHLIVFGLFRILVCKALAVFFGTCLELINTEQHILLVCCILFPRPGFIKPLRGPKTDITELH